MSTELNLILTAGIKVDTSKRSCLKKSIEADMAKLLSLSIMNLDWGENEKNKESEGVGRVNEELCGNETADSSGERGVTCVINDAVRVSAEGVSETVDTNRRDDDTEGENGETDALSVFQSHGRRPTQQPVWMNDYVDGEGLDEDEVYMAQVVAVEDPFYFAEAVKDAKWRQAMDNEMASIENNRTWTLTELPSTGHQTSYTREENLSLPFIHTLKNAEKNPLMLLRFTMGRTRKIPMAKRETAEQRSVTFTKRRQGLFNKAAELCRICDAQIAIMVSSTGSKEKVYAFGHSSVDAVFDKFLDDFPASEAAGASHGEIRSACNSLHEDIKAMENEVTVLMQNKKINVGRISWDFFEEFEKSSSVQELQDAVKSLESLLGKAKKKLNNPTGDGNCPSTGNPGISKIIEPNSDGLLALGLKPHDCSSSSLDYKVGQNSANIVEFISANYSDSWATSDGSPGNNGIDFPGEVDIDYIWDCIPSLDFNSDSDKVNSDTTSWTASGSASRSQENGDDVFPVSLDSGYLEGMEFLDYGINTTPDSDFGDIKYH
ncbi:hypothetical protein SADUNF_Sadunf18G0017800 [Salix dunnii]|uniref:MADS-box domain-containing protein n=1 Tax=Salix dunnii TaxID=1413687 RepID=A0A835J3E4_9ROSI|nr:hypothetical protein SADUNF_Sadunf18G0017800 [Salix dunnii]